MTEDQTTTLDEVVTDYVTTLVTTVVVVDVTQTATQTEDLTQVLTETDTAFITDTKTVDLTVSPTVTQTEDVTVTNTDRTTDTATDIKTVDYTDVNTVLQTSSTTVTVTKPATLYTTVTDTVDVTATAHITKTVDVTVTRTISSTTTKTITATTTQAAPTCGVNKVSNGGFDSKTLPPWTFSSTGGGRMDYAAGSGSPWALELYIINNTPSTAQILQTVTTIPGKIYTFSFRYNAQGGNSNSYLTCQVNNAANSGISKSLNQNKFQWLSASFTFSASGTSTIVICKVTGNSQSTGVYIDDISVAC